MRLLRLPGPGSGGKEAAHRETTQLRQMTVPPNFDSGFPETIAYLYSEPTARLIAAMMSSGDAGFDTRSPARNARSSTMSESVSPE